MTYELQCFHLRTGIKLRRIICLLNLKGPTRPPIQWVSEDLTPGVKRLGCEADHSPFPSAEMKNAWR